MKRINIIFICFITCIKLYSQITTINPSGEKLNPKSNEQYDSLKTLSDVLRVSQQSLIGQTLYFHPDTYGEKKGYYNITLYSEYPKDDKLGKIYKPVKVSDYVTYSVYEYVAGKYFIITACFQSRNIIRFNEDYYLQLVEKESKDTVYVKTVDLITKNVEIVGHYEKIKSKCTGKRYIIKRNVNEILNDMSVLNYKGLRRLDNAESIKNISKGTIFTCSNVSFYYDEWGSHLVLTLHNNEYGDCFIEDKEMESLLEDYEVFINRQHKDAEHKRNMFSKYGQTNGLLISEGKVKLGFTKAMCKDAWGEPVTINKTTTSYGTTEQWVYYGDSYLYFTNGKLTAIQN